MLKLKALLTKILQNIKELIRKTPYTVDGRNNITFPAKITAPSAQINGAITATGKLTAVGAQINGALSCNENINNDKSSTDYESQIGTKAKAGRLYLYSQNGNTKNVGLYMFNAANTARSVVDCAQGNTTYFRGTVTAISDLKKKAIIDDFDWKVDDFISGLKPIAYRQINDDGSRNNRIHMGFGAQHISQLAKDLELGDMSLYMANIKNDGSDPDDYMDKPYHGEEIDDEKLSWTLNYSELIAPLVLEVQRLMAKVEALEKEISVNH